MHFVGWLFFARENEKKGRVGILHDTRMNVCVLVSITTADSGSSKNFGEVRAHNPAWGLTSCVRPHNHGGYTSLSLVLEEILSVPVRWTLADRATAKKSSRIEYTYMAALFSL